MASLYLMRHGETLFNVQHKIQGWCDAPLTETGKAQAQAAAAWFRDKGIVFDHAYCSTSERTSDTLEIVTGGSMPYTRLKGLKEWNFGRFEGKDEFLNPPLPYGDFFKQFGGESEDELRERIVKTLKDIMEKPGHECVLAVSHGGSCANFCRAWAEHNVTQYRKGIKNCSIFRYDYKEGIFSCQEIIEPWQP